MNKQYSKNHVWVTRTEEGKFILGITQHAIDELGTVSFFDGYDADTKLDESMGTVESNKTVADIYAPFDLRIVKCNNDINYNKLNDDPEQDECWLFEILPDDISGLANLITAEEYKKFLGGQVENSPT